jgi:hypothetical protein
MQILLTTAMRLLTALIVASGATNAAATPLSPFRYEAQAQRHCPDDVVVWLDFARGVYYLKGQKRYARGATGSFVCRGEAGGSGYRRSLLGVR